MGTKLGGVLPNLHSVGPKTVFFATRKGKKSFVRWWWWWRGGGGGAVPKGSQTKALSNLPTGPVRGIWGALR